MSRPALGPVLSSTGGRCSHVCGTIASDGTISQGGFYRQSMLLPVRPPPSVLRPRPRVSVCSLPEGLVCVRTSPIQHLRL